MDRRSDPMATSGFRHGIGARIECERLPVPLRQAGARVVRCLGSLDSATLLERTAAWGAVTLAAPEDCALCPLGGGAEPPGHAARAATTALLTDMGLTALAPVLKRESKGNLARDDGAARRRARRGFLRRIAAPAGSRAVPVSPDPVAARMATLGALRRLAFAHRAALPPSFFPALAATEDCAGHGVCVATCTSGALHRYEADGLRGVEFDAARCTACGECVSRCPEHALTLNANGNGMVPAGVLRLSAHTLRHCARCEGDFVADLADELCPGCRKDAGLFQGLASTARGRTSANREFKKEVLP